MHGIATILYIMHNAIPVTIRVFKGRREKVGEVGAQN
jgi:hypothetical protein